MATIKHFVAAAAAVAATSTMSSSNNLADISVFEPAVARRRFVYQTPIRSMAVTEQNPHQLTDKLNSDAEQLLTSNQILGRENTVSKAQRKTKIACTIGPSTNSREMIWKLAEAGMNVARLNMSPGDHASHQKTIDLVKKFNAQSLDKGPEVRSGDVPQPITLKEGQELNFTIKRGVSTEDTVSINYDDFVNDVDVGDIRLADASHST